MADVVFSAIIDIEPKTKKNSQVIARGRGGRPFIMQSKDYQLYEAQSTNILKQNIKNIIMTKKDEMPINYPVNICALYYRATRRRVDLVNLSEALCDVLVNAGVLADDNFQIVASMDGSKVLIDRERPRTEVIITKLEDADIEQG